MDCDEMGRGRTEGGGLPTRRGRVELLSRIKSFKSNSQFPVLEDIVGYLRSTYRDYSRMKLRPFTKMVQETLTTSALSQQRGNQNSGISDSSSAPTRKKKRVEEDQEEGSEEEHRKQEITRKRTKGNYDGDQRLQRLEDVHLRKMRRSVHDRQSSSSSSSSDSNDDAEDESDEAVSTSEDAIFGDKVEPQFDLMKSMLRSSYMEINNPKLKSEKKNLELEVAKKITPANEGNRSEGMQKSSSKKEVSDPFEGLEMKRKNGPMFSNLGGMDELLEELKKVVLLPLYHPHVPQRLGSKPTTGILLHGPPGCGKTTLAQAIANETDFPFHKISAAELVSGISGSSEESIRELFSKAYKTAPSIVFIDEIEVIASKREKLQRETDKRIVTSLMTCMDQSHHSIDASSSSSDGERRYVLVIGATNRPDDIDPALRRAGRFDREFALGVPNEEARADILSVLTCNLRVEGSLDLRKIARDTPGFVGADLAYLTDEACRLALDEPICRKKFEFSREIINKEDIKHWWKQPWSREEVEKLSICTSHFEEAIKIVQPSSRREGFSSIPNVKWEDVGGLDQLREEFVEHIVGLIKSPEDYEGFGISREFGFLLYGPPGCGKTLIAKAVANEAGANFIQIKGAEILNKYVGESEQAVLTLFRRARTCSPCIVFFDEVDALITQRGKEGSWVVERVLTQLLVELNGGEDRRGVFVIGATNRPHVIDRAMLRPGRFGKCMYVPLPAPTERGLILKAIVRKYPVDASVDLIALGQSESCENFSGADLAELVNEAAMAARREKRALQTSGSGSLDAEQCNNIKTHHFEQALLKVTPSVTEEDVQFYQGFSESLRRREKKKSGPPCLTYRSTGFEDP